MKTTKNLGKLAWILILIFSLTSLQVHGQKEDTRNLKNFEKISFSISGDLFIEQGPNYSLKLVGDQKDLERIITEVKNDVLIIKTKSYTRSFNDVKVYVTLPALKGIDLAGSGDVLAGKTVKTESIYLSISGSGDIVFKDLHTTKADATVTGSGDIKLMGKATNELEITITGSGDIDAAAFEANSAEVDITGSGSAKVWVTDQLETNIVGSGSVRYKGKPLINANSVGSGSTKPL